MFLLWESLLVTCHGYSFVLRNGGEHGEDYSKNSWGDWPRFPLFYTERQVKERIEQLQGSLKLSRFSNVEHQAGPILSKLSLVG